MNLNPNGKSRLKPLAGILILLLAAPCAPAQDVATAQQKAISLYPDLAKAGSPLNAKFVALYQQAKQSNSPVLNAWDWPEVLARQAAAALADGTGQSNGAAITATTSPAPAQKEAQQASDAASLKGLREKVPISVRYAATVDGYFKGPFGKKLFKLYNEQCSIVDVAKKGVFQKCSEAVGWDTDETMTVYCPKSWNGSAKLGVYVNISPGDGPLNPRSGYSDSMDALNMIYVSPSGTSNDKADMRRIALALDSLATVRKQYPIDEGSIFVGGHSGGGAISVVMGINYPEFRGVICQCRNFYLGNPSCSPYVEEKDIRSIARRKQAYAFVTGPGDMNHDAIVESMATWKTYHIDSTVIENDIPGHTPASAKALKEALEWATAHGKSPQNSDLSLSDL